MRKHIDTKSRGQLFFMQTYEGDEIPKRTKWIFSSAGAFRDAAYQLVSSFLLTFMMYSGVLGTYSSSWDASGQ